MTNSLIIQIPFELARYAVSQRRRVNVYDSNQVIKALDTWLVLKHITTAGIIQNWNDQKQDLFKICKCSESIFRHRLKVLADLQLLTATRYNIKLHSWQHIEKKFSIDCKERLTIENYNANDNQRIQEWIIATEIKDNQSRQAFMINKRINDNPVFYNAVLTAIIAAGADRARLNDPDYILTWLQILYKEDFIKGSDIHHLLTEIRPDTNRGVKGIAKAWEARHPMTISYWKKLLQQHGIIDVSKLTIQSEIRQRNKECRVLWLDTKNIQKNFPLRRIKQTMLVMCDQITVLQPWQRIKNFFADAA